MVEINPVVETGKPLPLSPIAFHNAIMDKVEQLHGDFGVAAIRAGFTAKYCNEKTRIAIIRIRHGPHKLVTSSLPFITSVDKNDVAIRTLYTGATIRQCYKFLLVYQQRKYDAFCVELKTDEEKRVAREALLNLDNVLAIK